MWPTGLSSTARNCSMSPLRLSCKRRSQIGRARIFTSFTRLSFHRYESIDSTFSGLFTGGCDGVPLSRPTHVRPAPATRGVAEEPIDDGHHHQPNEPGIAATLLAAFYAGARRS